MPIVKSCDMNFDNKKFSVIIAGPAGIGKTTLALSAPKPLLIDLDDGISRVEAIYRKDTEVVESFEKLEKDLKGSDLSDYDTIVIDTGGKLFDILKTTAKYADPKNVKRDGNLSLQGYGYVKKRFHDFTEEIKSLGKNVVYVFHATEVKISDDMTGYRIRIEGSTKEEVWDNVDIGGFMEMKGNNRTIGFSNCDRYYAKGTHGIKGVFEVPLLEKGKKNTFLTDLFAKMRKNINDEQMSFNEYRKIMAECMPMIKKAENADDVNKACSVIAKTKHCLTSKDELGFAVKSKVAELGLTYDKETKLFKPKASDNA